MEWPHAGCDAAPASVKKRLNLFSVGCTMNSLPKSYSLATLNDRPQLSDHVECNPHT